jgi:hypothetical protein
VLSPVGSMKDRPARFVIEHGLTKGSLRTGMRLVETTSGHLGKPERSRLERGHRAGILAPMGFATLLFNFVAINGCGDGLHTHSGKWDTWTSPPSLRRCRLSWAGRPPRTAWRTRRPP